VLRRLLLIRAAATRACESERALASRGQARAAGVINAINAVIAAKSQYNIRVMNLSLGRPVFEPVALDPLCQAVEAAWKAGIVVVVAAGNQGRNNSAGTYGYGTIAAPGNNPSSAMQGFNLIWGSSLVWGSSSEMSAETVGIAINGEN
jgi:subtilisin family serine protease